ncbi:MAG: ABC transporter permease, partial [Lachnospiraceae bacterium]|nr:ABC transporter permease [Lachnospiraceae bacterium]
ICYDDPYEDRVDAAIDRIKALEDERCKARYDHVIGKGQEKIDEAESKIADAKAKIADGEKQLADAEKEYNEEVLKAENEIKDAKTEVADGGKEYEDGLAGVADNKADLKMARKDLLEAKEELEENSDKVAKARSEYEDKKKEFEEGEAEYLSKKAELEAAEEQFFAGFAAMGLTDREQILAMVSMDPELSATYAQIEAGKTELEAAGAQIEEGRAALKDGEKQVLEGEKQIEEAGKEWQDGWNKMIDGEYKIEKAERDLAKAKTDLEDAEKEIADGEKELAEGKEEYKTKTTDARKDIEEGKAKVADGEADLEDGKKKLADIDYPEWYVLKRSDSVQTYIEFGQDAERIGAVGRVFPAIFFLVAALVSLTTMTRMVEEERTQVGTLKALGYFKNRIAAKYGMYAVGASLIGGIIGVAVGHIVLPLVIIDAYKILYVALPEPIMPVNWVIAIASVFIAVLSTALATYIACYAELKGAPAQLMRPAVPKQGKRVFLERITFIWKHFSFTWKSTTRNLFRYKKRLFMTVFGIGGCMALLMVGFGLRDSIKQIVDNQYRTIWTYDAYLSIDENKETAGVTVGYPEIEDSLRARVVSVDAKTESTTKSINLMVPEKLDTLSRYVKLKDRVSGEKYELTDEGIIVSEKLAKMLNVKEGSEFELSDGDNGYVKVRVAAVTENYLYHYVYMSRNTYAKLYEKEPVYNQLMLELKDISDNEKRALSEKMLRDERILTYTDVETFENKVADMMHALDLVIWVLIISAGLLAFVVLYNLNNISIIERRRELATLKVLGFYDKEVAIYVYRENVVLTVLGILLG